MPNLVERIAEIEQELKKLDDEIYNFLDDDKPQRSDRQIQADKKALKKEKERLEKQLAEKPIPKEQEGKVYETFNDPNLNCNQWVIEIHKAGNEINGKFVEDFSVYKDLKYALARLGDTRTCMYFLMDYLNDNKQMFNFVLWRQNFENITGFKEQTYRDSINALFYYGILEKTKRIKRNSKNVCCKVYIFHADLKEEVLPKEKFNPKSIEHMKIVKERKD